MASLSISQPCSECVSAERRKRKWGTLPSECDLDGRGEAGGKEVGWEVRVHRQQLAGLAGGQLDTVLHGGRQRHLCKWVAGVDGCHLNGDTTGQRIL